MKNIAHEKNSFLFQAIAESVNMYGADGLQFMLLNLKSEKSEETTTYKHTLQDLFLEINKAIEIHGIDHVIFLIQNKKN